MKVEQGTVHLNHVFTVLFILSFILLLISLKKTMSLLSFFPFTKSSLKFYCLLLLFLFTSLPPCVFEER
jgi:hypothetical protein